MPEPRLHAKHIEMNCNDLPKIGRRSFLTAAAAATITTAATQAQTRDYGKNASPVRYPDADIVVIDKRFAKYKIGNTPIQRLYQGTLWAEGPAWSGAGRYLVWSDIPNDRQLRWLEEDGHVSVFRKPAGYSNGNTFDYEGRELSCEHDNRRVVRYEHTGKVTVLADKWEGKPLNAPNDIVVHPDGGIWFSDPGYGIVGNYEGHKADLLLKEAVYRIDPKSGKMEKVLDEMFKPNGLCFSPDYKKLYIADTGASHYEKAPRNIMIYEVVDATKLAKGREYVSMELGGKAGFADGMQCLLWRHQAQSAVHDRQPISIRRLRGNPRGAYFLNGRSPSPSFQELPDNLQRLVQYFRFGHGEFHK